MWGEGAMNGCKRAGGSVVRVSQYICGHLQKLKTRQSALKKTTALTNEEKQNWAAVMTVEMMSSEESDAGSDNDHVPATGVERSS